MAEGVLAQPLLLALSLLQGVQPPLGLRHHQRFTDVFLPDTVSIVIQIQFVILSTQ